MKETVILDSASYSELLEKANEAKYLAVDTETTTDDIRDGSGYCMGVSLSFRFSTELSRGVYSAYFPFRHMVGDNYGKDELALLKDVLESANCIIFHNAKFDLVSLGTLG